MREIKFRAWNNKEKEWYYFDLQKIIGDGSPIVIAIKMKVIQPMQHIGLKDKNGKEWFINDVGEFENGDRFVLKMEDWLEVSASWIGDPECEDQVRDLYRIENAKNIGNICENPELLK